MAHNMGVRKVKDPPHMVAIHEKIFIPVGTAITIVAAQSSLRVDVQANRIHVVRPHDEANHANRHHGIGHAEITENRLAREGRNDVTDNAEPGRIRMYTSG